MNFDLNTYGNIADIVAVPIAIIGVGFVASQLYLSRIQDKTENLKRQKEVTLDAYNRVRDDLSERLGSIRKKLGLNSMYVIVDNTIVEKILDSEKLRMEMTVILSIFERFSVGVHHEIYNRNLINDLSGMVFIQTYKQFEPYIHEVRKKSKTFYEEYEKLVRELEYIREMKKKEEYGT